MLPLAANNNDVPRWKAICLYRSEAGTIDVEHRFHEISDLHDLLERGPSWDTLISCTITLISPILDGLTVEEAARL